VIAYTKYTWQYYTPAGNVELTVSDWNEPTLDTLYYGIHACLRGYDWTTEHNNNKYKTQFNT